jgi:hypothetical protein
MTVQYADEDNSILSLISSVAVHYGVKTDHKTLPVFDQLLAKNYKNVVVMLLDGMGTEIINKHLDENAFLRRNMKCVISSVFPPTTTAATTSIETGMSPIEHGWLGWSLYFRELEANVNIFPNTLSGSGGIPAAAYNIALRYVPLTYIYDKIIEATKGRVMAERVSYYSSYRSTSFHEICETVLKLCKEDRERYIYTYWHQPDYDMHEFGTVHEIVGEDIRNFNNEIETLCRSLHDTLLIVTADHGLIDTKWRYICDYPDVAECLSRRPSIEARALSCPIKDGMHKQFEEAFNKAFKDCYILFTKQQVLDKLLFGSGMPNARSLDFIDDYLAVATDSTSIDYCPPADHLIFKAAHAGMTKEEMNVPFIAVECI